MSLTPRPIAILVLTATLFSAPAIQAGDDFTHTLSAVRSGHYVLDPAHSKVTWSVSHLGFSTYVGQFTGVEGALQLDSRNPTDSKLQATVQIDSVGTFHPQLDAHLKDADFFDAAKYPTATFRSTAVEFVDGDTAKITGSLTMRGVTRPIVIEADFNQAGINPLDQIYSLGFDGKTTIKRSEFGINYGLPALGDEVTLHLAAEFKLAPAGSDS